MMDYITVKNFVLIIDLHIMATYGTKEKSLPFCFSLYMLYSKKLLRTFQAWIKYTEQILGQEYLLEPRIYFVLHWKLVNELSN